MLIQFLPVQQRLLDVLKVDVGFQRILFASWARLSLLVGRVVILSEEAHAVDGQVSARTLRHQVVRVSAGYAAQLQLLVFLLEQNLISDLAELLKVLLVVLHELQKVFPAQLVVGAVGARLREPDLWLARKEGNLTEVVVFSLDYEAALALGLQEAQLHCGGRRWQNIIISVKRLNSVWPKQRAVGQCLGLRPHACLLRNIGPGRKSIEEEG